MPLTDINDLPLRQLKRTICGMMNFGKSSTIFIGVLNNGSVKGVKLNRAQVSGVTFLTVEPVDEIVGVLFCLRKTIDII